MKKTSEKPKVSIIIPTYNSEGTLSECLKAVLSQNYPFYEVIIVDNFSNDNTAGIAEEFEVKIKRQKCSPALARNIGIADSTGKYILFLDSDQTLSALVISECVEKCESEGAGMVRIPEVFIGSGFWGSCSAVWKNYYIDTEKLDSTANDMTLGEPRFFLREYVMNSGMLDARLLWGEDYELYTRLKKMNVQETSCKSKLHHYEPASIKDIMAKNFRYGESMTAFRQKTGTQVFPLLFKNALVTFKKVFRDFTKAPSIIVGCAILLYLKTCSMTVGSITGFVGEFLR